MADLTVRDARADDAPDIAQIHLAAWCAAFPALAPIWSTAVARAEPAKLAIAEIAGCAAGFCSYGPSRDDGETDVAEIYALYVHPQYWRRGAGRALCEHALAQAAQRECRAMTLWVLKENAPARRFYERLGYRPDGAERINRQLIGSPLQEMRYAKALEARGD